MGAKKGSKHKGTVMERTIKRVERSSTFERLSEKLHRWAASETSEVAKETINQLIAAADLIVKDKAEFLKSLTALKDSGYIPPKKVVVPAMTFEVGKRVWIRPTSREVFEKTYEGPMLDNLFCADMVKGKIIVSIGDPSKPGVIRFNAAKSVLQATNPAEVST